MSGILALAHLDGRPVDRALLERLTATMDFRGPDGRRTLVVGGSGGREPVVGFGHTLLRLNDDRDEPLPTLDRRLWIAADARLDGRDELARELRSRGADVSADAADAELVLGAYERWGEGCARRLLGDFAFALWDAERGRLFCARDVFGVAPLYYARMPGGLIVSNTLDCVRAHEQVSAELNEQAIADQIVFGGNQAWETTWFRDVRCVPPAHWLVADDRGVRVRRYYSIERPRDALRARRPEEYIERFRAGLQRAVADRLRSSRASVLMSGGLDSTSVAACAKRSLAERGEHELTAYTWTFDRAADDAERPFAELVARQLGIPMVVLVADRHLLDELRDDDSVDQRSPWQRAAARSRVMLTGLGGDPALYPDHFHWLRLLRQGRIGTMAADFAAHLRAHRKLPRARVRTTALRLAGRALWRAHVPPFLREDFATRVDIERRAERLTRGLLSDRSRTGMISPYWASLLASRDEERTRAPIKSCHPFFDLRLVELLLRVPSAPWLEDKHLLRRAFAGELPDRVRLRPKTPLAAWTSHTMACRHGAQRWMTDLARTPEIGRFVDTDALLLRLTTPAETSDVEYQAAARAVAVAHWLRRQGLSTAGD